MLRNPWSIVNEKTGKTYPLKDQEVVIVGRKLCSSGQLTITLEDDGSVSKKHALIKADGSTLTITDTGSKYGTFLINGNEELKITEYVASHNDHIRFGAQKSIITVMNRSVLSFKVLPTSLQHDQREKLCETLRELGCEVLEKFSSTCTHVTTNSHELTEKIACALAAAIPIVTLNYWPEYLMCLRKNRAVPDYREFVPVMDSMIIDDVNALLPNPERRQIFRGQTFVFFSEAQLKTYERVINLAGGKSAFFTDPILKKRIKQMIVQPPPEHEKPSDYAKVCAKIEREKKHPITEDEIALAILHCNLDKHCNPAFEWIGMLFPTEPVDNQGSILAAETQNLIAAVVKDATVIPESLTESQWSQDSTKKPVVSSITAAATDTCAKSGRVKSEDAERLPNSRKRPAAVLDSAGDDSPSATTQQALQPVKKAREIENPTVKPAVKSKVQLSLAAFFKRDQPSAVATDNDNTVGVVGADKKSPKKQRRRIDSPEPRMDQSREENRPVSSTKSMDMVLSPSAKTAKHPVPLSLKQSMENDTSEKKSKAPFKRAVPHRRIPKENVTRDLNNVQEEGDHILIQRNITPIVIPARRLTRKDMYTWVPKGKQ